MDYSILRYGAVADGVTNCAAAIQQAVSYTHLIRHTEKSLKLWVIHGSSHLLI